MSEKSCLDVHEPDGTASEDKEVKVLAYDMIKGTFEAGVAKTSSKVNGGQGEKLGCRIMKQMMEELRQWENSLAQKVMGDKDEYTPRFLVAGKSAQHLQSEGVELGQSLVESVGRMIDMLQLQMVGLHMQDWVEDVTLPVDQVVTDSDDSAKVGLVDSGKIFPVGDGHEELVSRGTSHAESVIEGTDKYTPTSVMPRNVTRGVVTQIQQFEEAVEVREVCTVCEYETPQTPGH